MMRVLLVLALVLSATVMAEQGMKISEELKSSLIAQAKAAVLPPSNACGAGSISLTGLTKTSGTDYTGSDGVYEYYMNVCAAALYGGADCSQKGFAICQYAGSTFVASLGTWNLASWASASSTVVTATLTDGDKCYQGGDWITRTAHVQFTCGHSSTSPTFSIAEGANCVFNLGLNANCGSGPAPPDPSSSGGKGPDGTSSGLSGGSVFLIILVVLLPIYIAAGCVYKTKTKGTSGVESCPNVDFWRDLPGLVKDGFRFTFSKCRGGSSSYNQV